MQAAKAELRAFVASESGKGDRYERALQILDKVFSQDFNGREQRLEDLQHALEMREQRILAKEVSCVPFVSVVSRCSRGTFFYIAFTSVHHASDVDAPPLRLALSPSHSNKHAHDFFIFVSKARTHSNELLKQLAVLFLWCAPGHNSRSLWSRTDVPRWSGSRSRP